MAEDDEDVDIFASSEDVYREVEDEYDLEQRRAIGSGVELDIDADYQDALQRMRDTEGAAVDEEPPPEEEEGGEGEGEGGGGEGEEGEGTGEAEEAGEGEAEEPTGAEEVEDAEDAEEIEEVQEEKDEETSREGEYLATCGTEGMLLVDSSHDTWPRDLRLFVLKSMYDVPLPEHAECLAVDVLLRMCDLDFEVEEPLNAEYMSPSGRAPFIRCGRQLVSEMDPILRHLARKGAVLSADLPEEAVQRQQELWSLVTSSLPEAELRVCWLHRETRRRLTLPKVAGLYPWPLSFFLGRHKRRRALAWLAAREGTGSDPELSLDTVYKQVDDVCNTLSTQLGDGPYFFGNKPTELEALIYGHLFLLLTVPVPVGEDTTLAQLIQEYPNLVSLVSKIDEEFLGRDLEIFMNE